MLDLDELEARIAEGEKRNFFVAPLVKELIAELREARGERAAVVAWLRDCAHRDAYRNHNRNRAEALWDAANIVESGEHRREEGA
jgi:hypothetical protein